MMSRICIIQREVCLINIIITELPERESPLLQLWDESEVKPGVSSDTLMV